MTRRSRKAVVSKLFDMDGKSGTVVKEAALPHGLTKAVTAERATPVRAESIELPAATATVHLVLADNHPIALQGMEHLLQREPDFRVLACCTDGNEALQAVRRYHPDVLVEELRMPGKSGFAVARELMSERLPTRVVLLTGNLNEDELLDGIRLGVKGVVLKDMPPCLLVQCIRKVHAGGTWLEKNSAGRAIDKLLRRESGAREVSRLLTTREIDIVRKVAAGLRNRDIAQKLCIAEGTVKTHLHNVYEKLQLSGRLEVALYARDRGLI